MAPRARPAAKAAASPLLAQLLSVDAALSKRCFARYGATQGLGRRALKVVERLGQGYLWFGIPIAVLLLSHDALLRRDAATLLVAMVLDLAVIASLKALIRRPRPPYNLPDMLVISVDKYSFPSGHASRCSLLACLGFSCNAALGEGALLALLFGLWALATAASRVAMGRHYVGDVLTGWLIGFAEFRAVQLVTGATFCS